MKRGGFKTLRLAVCSDIRTNESVPLRHHGANGKRGTPTTIGNESADNIPQALGVSAAAILDVEKWFALGLGYGFFAKSVSGNSQFTATLGDSPHAVQRCLRCVDLSAVVRLGSHFTPLLTCWVIR
ncbi:hypothetical protein SAMN04489740_3208 [Arthrobacter alpinus]|uniref:Uncharacterized protein n=1 Tax=Arthrobacter alpinus TaxID=656366 RepID=A0A1H5MX40_9MICC|nr:hypothetical protein SAMN04489740_3208 [Arthrobacter alpinus]